MFNKISELYWEIMGARLPRDVFGAIQGDDNAERLTSLEKNYQSLAKEFDPGNYIDNLDNRARAIEASEKLKELYEMAKHQLAANQYESVMAVTQSNMELISSPKGDQYAVMKQEQLANAPSYRLYVCNQQSTGRNCLLQIATDIKHNGSLDRMSYILKEFVGFAQELEEEYAKNPRNAGKELGYQYGFPELVDSFISSEQKNRRINILAFRCVADIEDMVALGMIGGKYCKRVDLRTSGWIMGKALKMIDFAHSNGVAVNATSERDIVVEFKKNKHYVVLFNWAEAEIFRDTVPEEKRLRDISQAAQSVIAVLGGDWKRNFLPDDGEKAFPKYSEYLLRLAQGLGGHNAERAHSRFYEIVDEFWPREFYPFTTKNLND